MEEKNIETKNKGFHMKFKNRWTVSIQIGPASYSDNYGKVFEKEDLVKPQTSNTAEVWAWNEDGKHYPEEPIGYLNSDEVSDFINKIKKRRD